MAEHRFFDTTQPQTLQGAVMLSYITLAFALLILLTGAAALALLPVGLGVGAYGIANERRWGYRLAVVVAALYVLQSAATLVGAFAISFFGALINLLFAVVLAVLLLHPQSREYQRIWFH